MSEPPRRFAPPWTVDEPTEGFCIRDANGQALAYVYTAGTAGSWTSNSSHITAFPPTIRG